MTLLQVMAENDRSKVEIRETDPTAISWRLISWGIILEQRPVTVLPDDAEADDILEMYRKDVDQIVADGDYRLVDVVRMRPAGDADWAEAARPARERFLDEHQHEEDEVRFFVDGVGCFYLHLDGMVYALVCESGDLISVPADTRHWFDMGAEPQFCAIRFFQEDDGWVGSFTGDSISRRMPDLDELLAGPK